MRIWLLVGFAGLLLLAGAARVQWERAPERREEQPQWNARATWRLTHEILLILVLLAVGGVLYLIEGIAVLGIPLDSLIFVALGVISSVYGRRMISIASNGQEAVRGKTLLASGGVLVVAGIGGLLFQ